MMRFRRPKFVPSPAGSVAIAKGDVEPRAGATLPVMYVPDPIAWASAEGFEFWGWIGPK